VLRFGLEVLEHIRFTRSCPIEYGIRGGADTVSSRTGGWRPLRSIRYSYLAPVWPMRDCRSTWRRWRSVLLASLGKALGPRRGENAGSTQPRAALGGSELYAHSTGNLAGAGKFCQEFAGDVLGQKNEVLQRLRVEENRDRQLKRLLAVLTRTLFRRSAQA